MINIAHHTHKNEEYVVCNRNNTMQEDLYEYIKKNKIYKDFVISNQYQIKYIIENLELKKHYYYLYDNLINIIQHVNNKIDIEDKKYNSICHIFLNIKHFIDDIVAENIKSKIKLNISKKCGNQLNQIIRYRKLELVEKQRNIFYNSYQ